MSARFARASTGLISTSKVYRRALVSWDRDHSFYSLWLGESNARHCAIVGFATSAPELLVAGTASLNGNPTLAIGNAIGSSVNCWAPHLVLGQPSDSTVSGHP